MPRAIDEDLRDCLERANPYVEYRIEVSQPDVGQILRRQDQFLNAPSLVSMSPASSLAASSRGALTLTPATAALQSFTGVQSSYDLNIENQQRRYKGVAWTMDRTFSRVTLKSITAKVERVPFAGFFFDSDIELQIFRITKTPGAKVSDPGTSQYKSVAWIEYTFTPLLSPAPTLKAAAQTWDGSNRTTLNFDLTNWNLTLENSPAKAVTADQVGELPEYLIVVRLAARAPGGTGHFKWLVDTASPRTGLAGIGSFERVNWARNNDQEMWTRSPFADVPNFALNIETYPVTGQGIFMVDQGKAPSSVSTGRVDFQRSLPPGTSATAEISTAGSGGPWTAVKHGDLVTPAQQSYHLRLTLNSDTPHRASPQIHSFGVEFRIPRDVSIEGIPDLPTREIDMPYPKASIPEGRLRVVRTGIRDYLDVGSALGSTAPTPRLEADIFLASRHPSVTRDKWLRLERLLVSNRVPSATSEEFTLISYASRLKRKIPQKSETINSVHTVQIGSTPAQLIVSPALPGTSVSGNEYDGQLYYIRVRSSTAPNTRPGFVATVQGNTSTDRLDFSPALPEALVAADVVEVHSGIFQTAPVSYVDADPADVWDSILSLLAIPPERVGLGYLPRGGKPPKVADIAPGDATTQNKRRITVRLSEEEAGDELLDQISTILGGVTLEIDGQIVFIQLIPLTDLAGNVTVPLAPPVASFDSRDIGSLSTPPGLEKRTTIVNCAYGVPATAAAPDAFPSKSTTSVDGDALLWLAQQDLEDYGSTDVDDKITRWLYNSTDAGLYLASVIGTQMVRVGSTGIRIFSMGMAEKHPRIVPGDVVILATDQYTDYDPSTQTPIAGPIAIRGVIVRAGAEGRQLAIFIPGLIDNVQTVKAGVPAPLPGLGPPPAPPELTATFDVDGQLIVNSSGDFATATHKIAWDTVLAPTAATVRAATAQIGQKISGLASGDLFDSGTTVYIAAFAYSATGVESSPIATFVIQREGIDRDGTGRQKRAKPFDDGFATPRGTGGGDIDGSTGHANGGSAKRPSSGRDDSPPLVHGASRSFPTNFQNPAKTDLRGGVSYQPASVWGTSDPGTNTDFGSSAPAATAQIDETYPISESVSGYTVRARLRQSGTSTARSNAFPAGAITTNGGDKQVTVASAPAFDDTYFADFTYSFQSTGGHSGQDASSVSATVSLQYFNGSVWVTLATFTDSDSDPGTANGGTGASGISGSASLSGTQPGLTGSSLMRVLLSTNAGQGVRTYSVDPGNLTYTTTTGEQYARKTPTGVNVLGSAIGAS